MHEDYVKMTLFCPLPPENFVRGVETSPVWRQKPDSLRSVDGAPAGEYVVNVVWLIENPKTKREWSPLPTRYMAPDKSGVRVTIREGTNDLQPFQLTW